MSNGVLPALIAVLTVVAVVSAAVLVHAAYIKPRIGALTERAIGAVVIAVFGFVYSIVAFNNQLALDWWTTEVSVFIVRCGVVTVLLIPAWWTFLYLSGRLR